MQSPEGQAPQAAPDSALLELRTDVRPILWGIAATLVGGVVAFGLALHGELPLNAGWPALGAAAAVAAWLAVRVLGQRAVVYRVTAQRIEIERGYLAKRFESIDLFRVKDVVLEQGLVERLRGVGRLTLHSSDDVEPLLAIGPVRDAKALFLRLRDAVGAARRATGVAVLQ